jgi:hypothetical protein
VKVPPLLVLVLVLERESEQALRGTSQSITQDKPNAACTQTITKELNNLYSLAKSYQLDIPKGKLAGELNPAQQSVQDVRSNSV